MAAGSGGPASNSAGGSTTDVEKPWAWGVRCVMLHEQRRVALPGWNGGGSGSRRGACSDDEREGRLEEDEEKCGLGEATSGIRAGFQ